MTTAQIRQKMLAMFPDPAKPQMQKLIDTLIARAKDDGKVAGHKEAATMIEVLVLGSTEHIDREQLADMMNTLRGAASEDTRL